MKDVGVSLSDAPSLIIWLVWAYKGNRRILCEIRLFCLTILLPLSLLVVALLEGLAQLCGEVTLDVALHR